MPKKLLLCRNIGDTGDDSEGEGAGGLVGVLAEAEPAPLLGEGHQGFEVAQPPATRHMSARATVIGRKM